jgi:putative membrane protein
MSWLAAIYPWLKAFHILAVIAWMAAMLYLPRLFVYHMGAAPGGELDTTLRLQERRLLRVIMTPSMIAVWILGLLMVSANPALAHFGWLQVKLFLVLVMSGIHGFYVSAQRKFAAGGRPRSERFWRIMNEVPFVLLIAIVILAVVKPF